MDPSSVMSHVESQRNDDSQVIYDELEEVIMAIDIRDSGTVGCSYYVAQDEKIYLLSDIISGNISVIETCRLLQCPIIYVSKQL
jgi:DNA mismatch repair protein MSH5